MSDDALSMFSAMRPAPPSIPPEIRQAANTGQRDLHGLAMVPGTPGYNARIPRPPCFRCGEDHVPGLAYDHEWVREPTNNTVHDEPVTATSIRRPQVYEAPPPTQTVTELPVQSRVALYVGRGDTYVVAAEAAPDWETIKAFKVEPSMVVPMIQLVRALGIKIQDKTGGDLVMLTQEYEDAGRQPAQAHDRGAASDGDRGARRPEPGPAGTEMDQPQAG